MLIALVLQNGSYIHVAKKLLTFTFGLTKIVRFYPAEDKYQAPFSRLYISNYCLVGSFLTRLRVTPAPA